MIKKIKEFPARVVARLMGFSAPVVETILDKIAPKLQKMLIDTITKTFEQVVIATLSKTIEESIQKALGAKKKDEK